ncbi:MAG: hypothetical protein AAB582_01160 [Patescibacteria group bacterium]
MRGPDLDRERSEKKLSIQEFLSSYNDGLPAQFPRASLPILALFEKAFPELFKKHGWSLDQHRKKVMDWLPTHIRANERE